MDESFPFVTNSPPETGASTPQGGGGGCFLSFRTLHAASLLPRRIGRKFSVYKVSFPFSPLRFYPPPPLRSSHLSQGDSWLARWQFSVLTFDFSPFGRRPSVIRFSSSSSASPFFVCLIHPLRFARPACLRGTVGWRGDSFLLSPFSFLLSLR